MSDDHSEHLRAHAEALRAVRLLPLPTDRPRIIDPWWRAILVRFGLAKPRYGISAQDYANHIQAHLDQVIGVNDVVRGTAPMDPGARGVR